MRAPSLTTCALLALGAGCHDLSGAFSDDAAPPELERMDEIQCDTLGFDPDGKCDQTNPCSHIQDPDCWSMDAGCATVSKPVDGKCDRSDPCAELQDEDCQDAGSNGTCEERDASATRDDATGDGGSRGPCNPGECGPGLGGPVLLCDDGSIAGYGCERGADGSCGFVWHDCPAGGNCGGLQCAPDQFCAFEPGHCGARGEGGTCRLRPDGCAALYQPVCGCDNRSYSVDCEAAISGISVKHPGLCTPEECVLAGGNPKYSPGGPIECAPDEEQWYLSIGIEPVLCCRSKLAHAAE